MRKLALFATVAGVAAAPALAQTTQSTPHGGAQGPARADAARPEVASAVEVVRGAAAVNRFEVAPSQIALQRTQNEQVRR